MAWSLDGLHHKGIPLGVTVDADTLAGLGWVLAAGGTATPVATLDRDALEHNAAAMAAYCERHGASLAPHAKTTLSPELWEIQRRHGAWAMTAALPRQAALLWAAGHDQVLIANEVTDPAAVQWLCRERDVIATRRLWVYADSTEGVAVLAEGASRGESSQPLDVLLELGHRDGRTGCRDAGAAIELARAIQASPTLRLAGVAAYEGTIGATRDEATATQVDGFLTEVGAVVETLAAQGLFAVGEPLVTAGGSVWFDRVTAILGPVARAGGGRLVLRSGCYLTHDHGMYAEGTPAATGVADAPAFRPAMSVWARVVSRPEPGLALLDAGRRDVSYDAGLPVPLEAFGRDGSGPVELTDAVVTGLSDQHAFLQLPESTGLAPGDLVRLGISHPCTTFDRWATLLLTDADTRVVGAVQTLF